MSFYPIGMDEPTQGMARRRASIERIEARNELAKVKSESEMHRLASDRNYVEWVYDKMEGCEDERAQVVWAKVVAEILRLGKSSVNPQTPAQSGASVNIRMSDEQARQVLQTLAQSSGSGSDSIIDVAALSRSSDEELRIAQAEQAERDKTEDSGGGEADATDGKQGANSAQTGDQ